MGDSFAERGLMHWPLCPRPVHAKSGLRMSANESPKRPRQVFDISLFKLLIFALPYTAQAQYLEIRHWDGLAGIKASQENSSLAPFLFWQNSRLRLDINFQKSREHEMRAKSREPVSLDKTGKHSLRNPSVLVKLSPKYPLSFHWENSDLGWGDYFSQRSLYSSKGSFQGTRALQARQKTQQNHFAVIIPLPARFAFTAGIDLYEGERRSIFEQSDVSGKTQWSYQENWRFKGWQTRMDVFVEAAPGWLLGAGISNQTTLNIDAYELKPSTANTAPGKLPLPREWRAVLWHQSNSKIFQAQITWQEFSKLNNPGFFLDNPAVQKSALGPKASAPPASPHDTLSLRFSFETPVSSRVNLKAGSRLSSHPVERRLIQPLFSLGAAVSLGKGLTWKTDGTFVYRDYFGDGILWAPDQRVMESRLSLRSGITWEF